MNAFSLSSISLQYEQIQGENGIYCRKKRVQPQFLSVHTYFMRRPICFVTVYKVQIRRSFWISWVGCCDPVELSPNSPQSSNFISLDAQPLRSRNTRKKYSNHKQPQRMHSNFNYAHGTICAIVVLTSWRVALCVFSKWLQSYRKWVKCTWNKMQIFFLKRVFPYGDRLFLSTTLVPFRRPSS